MNFKKLNLKNEAIDTIHRVIPLLNKEPNINQILQNKNHHKEQNDCESQLKLWKICPSAFDKNVDTDYKESADVNAVDPQM